jgi:hypothetical protein
MSDKYIKNLTNNVCYTSYDPNECKYQIEKSANNVKKMYEKFNNSNDEFNYIQNELDETLIQSSLVNEQSKKLMNKRYNSVQEIEKMTDSTNMKKNILKNRINLLAKKEIKARNILDINLDNLERAKFNLENIIENFSEDVSLQQPSLIPSQNIPQEPSLNAEPVNLESAGEGGSGMDSKPSQDIQVQQMDLGPEAVLSDSDSDSEKEADTDTEETVDDDDMAVQSNKMGIDKPIINENTSGGCSSYTDENKCESNTDAQGCYWWGNMCNNKQRPITQEDARQINNKEECDKFELYWSSKNGTSSCFLNKPEE